MLIEGGRGGRYDFEMDEKCKANCERHDFGLDKDKVQTMKLEHKLACKIVLKSYETNA